MRVGVSSYYRENTAIESTVLTSEVANRATTAPLNSDVCSSDNTLWMSPRSHRELWSKSLDHISVHGYTLMRNLED